MTAEKEIIEQASLDAVLLYQSATEHHDTSGGIAAGEVLLALNGQKVLSLLDLRILDPKRTEAALRLIEYVASDHYYYSVSEILHNAGYSYEQLHDNVMSRIKCEQRKLLEK